VSYLQIVAAFLFLALSVLMWNSTSPCWLARRVLLALVVASCVPASAAGGPKSCREITFISKITSEPFRRAIGNGLAFRFNEKREGMYFEIGPVTTEPNEWDKYIYTVTPPYRFRGVTDVSTDYGTPAQEAIKGKHQFSFLLNRSDGRRGGALLNKVLWPASDREGERAFDQLSRMPKGRGTFRVIDATIKPGEVDPKAGSCVDAQCGEIQSMKFEVTLVVPRTFKIAPGLDARPVTCSFAR